MEGYTVIIKTGNEDLDRRLTGLPFPALIMIEGDHGTGKSVLAAQICYGLLISDKKGYVITTEQTTKDYLVKMRDVKINLIPFFIKGSLGVAPLNTNKFNWNSDLANKILDLIIDFVKKRKNIEFLIIDSLSVLATFAEERQILQFMKESRVLVDLGKLILFTIHPDVFSEEIKSRITSIVDVYFKLSAVTIGGRRIKVLERVKTVGGIQGSDTISFDIDPALGIKVIPLSLSRA
ncbi:ATPase domain-containing protein [Sulfurisphaera tokodaii]|uniref:Flagella accessory protein FlaH n=2 Tax=Sulfurisphaera tokodaii TaxID=111955 RepID=Q96XJ2_SULTO|nr:ATPase domain-containing protein [Sulfurisphaera tokodaii]BAB67635.1 putative flagella accessory protein FlaH [Sulfurisphaera tokodaii str. 7]HII75320.1 flagellar accessory protein FlaH [Sulfurisphaera tokodaii]